MGFFNSIFGKSSKASNKGSPTKDAESPGAEAPRSKPAASSKPELEQEIARLKAREASMVQTISELRNQQDVQEQQKEMTQEKLNMMDFKYQLILDMFAMQELDRDEDARQGTQKGGFVQRDSIQRDSVQSVQRDSIQRDSIQSFAVTDSIQSFN